MQEDQDYYSHLNLPSRSSSTSEQFSSPFLNPPAYPFLGQPPSAQGYNPGPQNPFFHPAYQQQQQAQNWPQHNLNNPGCSYVNPPQQQPIWPHQNWPQQPFYPNAAQQGSFVRDYNGQQQFQQSPFSQPGLDPNPFNYHQMNQPKYPFALNVPPQGPNYSKKTEEQNDEVPELSDIMNNIDITAPITLESTKQDVLTKKCEKKKISLPGSVKRKVKPPTASSRSILCREYNTESLSMSVASEGTGAPTTESIRGSEVSAKHSRRLLTEKRKPQSEPMSNITSSAVSSKPDCLTKQKFTKQRASSCRKRRKRSLDRCCSVF